MVAHQDAKEEAVGVLVNLGHRISEAREKEEAADQSGITTNDAQELLREVFRMDRE